MAKIETLIRFGWAIKRILRDKANFDVLEGFLTVVIGRKVSILQILESESNKETSDDRFNRVDLLVKDMDGTLMIIEVQNNKQHDYFHRMLYGASKVISEHIKEGAPYTDVKKVISITIAYFDLGQGQDYVYHGTNQFKGIHKGDVLSLGDRQKELYPAQEVHQIFPEYWLIKVDQFDDRVKDKLDEWIYFLKNSLVEESFTAPGLREAREKLSKLQMPEHERAAYQNYLKWLREVASYEHTAMAEHRHELRVLQEEHKAELEVLQSRIEQEKAAKAALEARMAEEKATLEARMAEEKAALEARMAEEQQRGIQMAALAIRALASSGMSADAIAASLGVPLSQVTEALSEDP